MRINITAILTPASQNGFNIRFTVSGLAGRHQMWRAELPPKVAKLCDLPLKQHIAVDVSGLGLKIEAARSEGTRQYPARAAFDTFNASFDWSSAEAVAITGGSDIGDLDCEVEVGDEPVAAKPQAKATVKKPTREVEPALG